MSRRRHREAIEMQYVGAVIQQLWTDERGGRARSGRRRRSAEVPGSVRRRKPERPSGLG